MRLDTLEMYGVINEQCIIKVEKLTIGIWIEIVHFQIAIVLAISDGDVCLCLCRSAWQLMPKSASPFMLRASKELPCRV